jgi:putative oxidoreductase
MKKIPSVIYWILRVLAAVIMIQTLYFKFTGASESVEIFTTVGMEPWGRIGIGVLELVASVLLLINATAWLGAALGAGLMGGAVFMHLTILGISVGGDNGYLFALALIVLMACIGILIVNRDKIRALLHLNFNS